MKTRRAVSKGHKGQKRSKPQDASDRRAEECAWWVFLTSNPYYMKESFDRLESEKEKLSRNIQQVFMRCETRGSVDIGDLAEMSRLSRELGKCKSNLFSDRHYSNEMRDLIKWKVVPHQLICDAIVRRLQPFLTAREYRKVWSEWLQRSSRVDRGLRKYFNVEKLINISHHDIIENLSQMFNVPHKQMEAYISRSMGRIYPQLK